MKTKHTFSYALLGGLGLLLALQGCGDDEDKNPKPPVIGDGGGDNTGNTGTGAKAGTGGKNGGGTDNEGGVGNNGPVGGTDPVGPVGGEGGGAPYVPECNLPELGEDGCFNCPENGETVQFLNRCLETDCEPFDNDRLPQLEDDGSLPDLP